MTIDLHITADTAEELRTKVKNLLGLEDKTDVFAPGTTGYGPTVAAGDAPEVIPVTEMADQSEQPKPKRQSRKKAEPEVLPPETALAQEKRAEANAPKTGDAPAPEFLGDDAKALTIEDIRAALSEVLKTTGENGGMPGALKILGQYKAADGTACTKAPHIQPSDYAAVIADCKKVAA